MVVAEYERNGVNVSSALLPCGKHIWVLMEYQAPASKRVYFVRIYLPSAAPGVVHLRIMDHEIRNLKRRAR